MTSNRQNATPRISRIAAGTAAPISSARRHPRNHANGALAANRQVIFSRSSPPGDIRSNLAPAHRERRSSVQVPASSVSQTAPNAEARRLTAPARAPFNARLAGASMFTLCPSPPTPRVRPAEAVHQRIVIARTLPQNSRGRPICAELMMHRHSDSSARMLHALLREELQQPVVPEEAHSQEEPEEEPGYSQAEIRNPMLRPHRANRSLEQDSDFVPTRSFEFESQDVVGRTCFDTAAAFCLGSQTRESSSSERCPVCTLPKPCSKHSNIEEDGAHNHSISVSSRDGVSGRSVSSDNYRAASRSSGSEISGIYRRPRRGWRHRRADEIIASVDDSDCPAGETAEPASENSRLDRASITAPADVQDVNMRGSNTLAVDAIMARNEAIRRSVVEDAAHETRNDQSGEPDSASRRRRRRGKRTRAHAKEIESDAPGENRCSDSCAPPADSSAVEVDDCPICLAPLIGKCAKTRCGHHFHMECLERHLLVTAVDRPSCPICRWEMRLTLPVSAKATSGRAIEVLHRVPPEDSRCHLDRGYTFMSLGGFAKRPRMLYVVTSNEDKWTSPSTAMWTLTSTVPTTVYLNFRSNEHVTATGASKWLRKGGWTPIDMESTISTGWPNGPYEGPVFSRDCEPGKIYLMGSNCQEGTYFVFVELRDKLGSDDLPWDLSQVLA